MVPCAPLRITMVTGRAARLAEESDMPTALVVYDARAERMADAVCAGLERAGIRPVIGTIADVKPQEAALAELLIVGDAIAAIPSPRQPATAVQRWLASVPQVTAEGRMAAAFDVLPASVAAGGNDLAMLASRDLGQLGYRIAALPASFRVDESGDAAEPDEVYRAYHWGIFAAEGAQRGRTTTTRLRVRSARPPAAATRRD